MRTLEEELREALYALNRAITKAGETESPGFVEMIEGTRDQTWSLIAMLSGKE